MKERTENTGKGIGFKLALIILAVILPGIIITASVSIIIAGNVIIDETLAKIENGTASEAAKMDGWLSSHKTQVSALAAALSKFENYSGEYLRPIFRAEINENPSYQEVYMGFPDDTAIMGNFDDLERLYANGWKASMRGWYQIALTDTSLSHITSPYIDSNTGILCITSSRAVVDGGRLIGVAATDILINTVEEQTASVTLGVKDGFAVLLDKNGDILIHPDPALAPDAEGNFKNLASAANGAYAKLWSLISD
jgi:methyl-accepting chemotaxis protein